jgi:hypothetical protein
VTAWSTVDSGVPVLSRPLERVLCVLVAAGAVKTPLGIPLYLNALLLLLGAFSLVMFQALPRVFLWMVALVGLGTLGAGQLGILADSGPRLIQLLLTVFAAALITPLDPELLGWHSRCSCCRSRCRRCAGCLASTSRVTTDCRASRTTMPCCTAWSA